MAEGTESRADVAEKMTREQIAEARRLAREFVASPKKPRGCSKLESADQEFKQSGGEGNRMLKEKKSTKNCSDFGGEKQTMSIYSLDMQDTRLFFEEIDDLEIGIVMKYRGKAIFTKDPMMDVITIKIDDEYPEESVLRLNQFSEDQMLGFCVIKEELNYIVDLPSGESVPYSEGMKFLTWEGVFAKSSPEQKKTMIKERLYGTRPPKGEGREYTLMETDEFLPEGDETEGLEPFDISVTYSKHEQLNKHSPSENKREETRRKRLSDKVKMYVWRRDNGRCVECGSKELLEYDHIIPVSKGGSNTERNIQILCERCNRSKGAKI